MSVLRTRTNSRAVPKSSMYTEPTQLRETIVPAIMARRHFLRNKRAARFMTDNGYPPAIQWRWT
jgi:hypothetical protein